MLNNQTVHFPNIISASRRTDVPAFFASWLKKRLNDGFVVIKNPYNSKQTKLISLKEKDVFCFVFWTKNPVPVLEFYSTLKKYPHYFLITITGYGRAIEPNVPEKDFVISAIKKLYSDGLEGSAVVWRYDPIIITDAFSFQWHYSNFEAIASALTSYVDTCIISFFDTYDQNLSHWDPLLKYSLNEIYDFSANLAAIAKKYGITLQTCSELLDLDELAIQHGACIDSTRIAQIRLLQGFTNTNESLYPNESQCQVCNDAFIHKQRKKDYNQRSACLCAKSIDIGAYHTCGHGCKYCYAKGKLKPFPQPEDSPCLGVTKNFSSKTS